MLKVISKVSYSTKRHLAKGVFLRPNSSNTLSNQVSHSTDTRFPGKAGGPFPDCRLFLFPEKNKQHQEVTKLNWIKKSGEYPRKAPHRIPYRKILMVAGLNAYFLMLNAQTVLADDMWSKAETIMKDVYGKIVGISTIAAIVTASVALLLMNFSKSGKTVDESRAWLKRIAVSWAILNGLGFIMAYVTPFFSDGRWNG